MNDAMNIRARWAAGDRDDIRVVDNVGQAYRDLRKQKWIDLLGRWVSGLPPVQFEQVDVSPEILMRIGISHSARVSPQFTAEMHVTELMR